MFRSRMAALALTASLLTQCGCGYFGSTTRPFFNCGHHNNGTSTTAASVASSPDCCCNPCSNGAASVTGYEGPFMASPEVSAVPVGVPQMQPVPVVPMPANGTRLQAIPQTAPPSYRQ